MNIYTYVCVKYFVNVNNSLHLNTQGLYKKPPTVLNRLNSKVSKLHIITNFKIAFNKTVGFLYNLVYMYLIYTSHSHVCSFFFQVFVLCKT